MAHQTGDIFIWDKGVGHVAMAYDRDTVIQANAVQNFHKQSFDADNGLGGVADRTAGTTMFRPPWQNRADEATKKRELQDVADRILVSGKYGKYRAMRLMVGSNLFGSGAKSRLSKYKARQTAGYVNDAGDAKFVTTLTCVEAVVLCFQLVFPENDPLFIRLDAAHTMPSSLRKWLRANWAAGQEA